MAPELSKVSKQGSSLYALLPLAISKALRLNPGDRLAMRLAGDKLIVERIQLEKLALLRTGEAAGQ